ncbi:MAG: hypothetical protein M1818_006042 [Claussenomyces sp. TS43310]|nr:MAG: hypothetical protein M1818_006042 [Claussenomyces sp. TS43310]
MASVVYDGAGNGGRLFAGKRFWVAQRVPSRSRWLELIKANGGQVVTREKDADIMIADHARKDAPPGSYSWRFIEQSVKKGSLESLNDHAAGRPAGTPRPIGSVVPARGSRTPFTAEDDRILMDWVIKAERRGSSVKGNQVYQVLEKINPRHTFQSWRDRWIKHLQHRRVEEQRFTARDAELLVDAYDDILNLDEAKTAVAWQEWAKANPQHTAAEWQMFWSEDVRPREEQKRTVTALTSSLPVTSQSGQSQTVHSSTSADTAELPASKPTVLSEKAAMSQEIAEEESRDAGSNAETHFQRTLKDFADEAGFEVDFYPTVCNRRFSLFRLWQTAGQQKHENTNEVDGSKLWTRIARSLNFNTFRASSAPEHLKKLYEDKLLEFDETKAEYREYLKQVRKNGGALDELQMQELQDFTDDLVPFDEEADDLNDLDRLPATEKKSSPKRGHSTSLETSIPQKHPRQQSPRDRKKKLRIDDGKEQGPEIPSTPEELLKVQRHQIIRETDNLVNDTEETDAGFGNFGNPVKRRLFESNGLRSGGREATKEPETQDFHFSIPYLDQINQSTNSDQESSRQLQHKMETAGSLHDDSSTQSQTDSQRQETEFQQFIDHHISLGYPEDLVYEALQATTLETGDAALVMEELMSGRGLPNNMQGVWTDGDDAVVKSGVESDDYRRILHKHGEERCAARTFFLKAQDENDSSFT